MLYVHHLSNKRLAMHLVCSISVLTCFLRWIIHRWKPPCLSRVKATLCYRAAPLQRLRSRLHTALIKSLTTVCLQLLPSHCDFHWRPFVLQVFQYFVFWSCQSTSYIHYVQTIAGIHIRMTELLRLRLFKSALFKSCNFYKWHASSGKCLSASDLWILINVCACTVTLEQKLKVSSKCSSFYYYIFYECLKIFLYRSEAEVDSRCLLEWVRVPAVRGGAPACTKSEKVTLLWSSHTLRFFFDGFILLSFREMTIVRNC